MRGCKLDKRAFSGIVGLEGNGDGQLALSEAWQSLRRRVLCRRRRHNHCIQVLDNNGRYKRQFPAWGNPQAICLTTGANPVLYVSNTNPPNNIDTAGEIYKMDLNGKLLGKFGRAGKMLKEFGTTNAIDCRNPNQLYVGEIGNLRVQKITLR